MIIASHDLDFLTQIANTILVLKEGKIIKQVNVSAEKTPIDLLKTYYE